MNVISKEDFEKMTPPVPRANNPDVPPPPPGMSASDGGSSSSNYDEVFEMEDEEVKSPRPMARNAAVAGGPAVALERKMVWFRFLHAAAPPERGCMCT